MINALGLKGYTIAISETNRPQPWHNANKRMHCSSLPGTALAYLTSAAERRRPGPLANLAVHEQARRCRDLEKLERATFGEENRNRPRLSS